MRDHFLTPNRGYKCNNFFLSLAVFEILDFKLWNKGAMKKIKFEINTKFLNEAREMLKLS